MLSNKGTSQQAGNNFLKSWLCHNMNHGQM